MPRTATETSTKAATKRATTKTTKDGKPKEKRAPSAYNMFMSEGIKKYREENPGTQVKDAMKAVAELWKVSPKNPKNGAAPKTDAKTKAKAAPKPKSTGKENVSEESD